MRILLHKLLAIICLATLLQPCPLFAVDQPIESDRLKELNQKIKTLQDERKAISADISANEKLSGQLTQEVQVVQESLRTSAIELGNLQSITNRLSLEISDYTEHYKELAQKSAARLRAMYMLGGGQQMALTVSSEGKASLGQITHYMNALRTHEVANMTELKRLSAERSNRIRELDAKKLELQNLQDKAQKQQEDLRKKQADLELAKVILKKQSISKSRNLSELRAEALRIETVLSSMLESGSDKLLPNDKVPPSAQASSAAVIAEVKAALPDASTGHGLSDKFTAPVKGIIVTRFGSSVTDGLDQQIKSKGLGFVVPEGQEVDAVAAGKVSFVGTLGTYGNVVIIDHGNRMYTLYSQLATAMVTPGQSINERDIVGKVGSVVLPRPYNLYFEVRKEGRAIDPKPFLPRT